MVERLYSAYEMSTPLISAVLNKRIDLVESLLQEGVDIDQRDDKGYTALMYSYMYFMPKIMQLLLDYGANPNIGSGISGQTLLEIAILRKDLYTIRLLSIYGAR